MKYYMLKKKKSFAKLNYELERAINELENLSKIKPNWFEPDISLSDNEQVIYSLSKGEVGLRGEILKTKREVIYNYYYLAQVKKLNEMLRTIEEIKAMRKD